MDLVARFEQRESVGWRSSEKGARPIDTAGGYTQRRGTEATAGLLLLRLTDAPPAGAGALSVTVPCEVLPAGTLVGLRLSALGWWSASHQA